MVVTIEATSEAEVDEENLPVKEANHLDDPIWAFCKDFNSANGCTTANCTKKHSCSQRLAGGIICNQKTYWRPQHDAQY